MLSHAIGAGRELIDQKRSMAHGEFGKWCRDNLTFTERHAQRYMQLAKTDTRVAFDPDLGIKAAIEAVAEKRPASAPALDLDTARRALKLAALANSPNEHEAASRRRCSTSWRSGSA